MTEMDRIIAELDARMRGYNESLNAARDEFQRKYIRRMAEKRRKVIMHDSAGTLRVSRPQWWARLRWAIEGALSRLANVGRSMRRPDRHR